MPAYALKLLDEGDLDKDAQPTSAPVDTEDLARQIQLETAVLVTWVKDKAQTSQSFMAIERGLIPQIFLLGRLFVALFLACREAVRQHSSVDRLRVRRRWYQRKPSTSRWLATFFGKVTYSRTYYHPEGGGSGFHPLDQELGLTSDRFSLNVVSMACRLATQLPYGLAVNLFSQFLGWSPAVSTVEQMVLGLGIYTQKYFDGLGAIAGDGEVLVIQIDCKAIPTATKQELRKRRGKRKPNPHPGSARHRGRAKRKQWSPKKRRKKGDKSKNGRSATLVVMYTLKASPDDGLLLGPVNKMVYASFSAKRHAFAWARQMAERRGFPPGSNKFIQFLSDGDKDFRVYLQDYFSDYADHEFLCSLDLIHVMEYLWKAGKAQHEEGSQDLTDWAQKQKRRLLESRADLVLAELKRWLAEIPKSGPGNKRKRKRLTTAIGYIEDNLDRMDYQYLKDCDLELATGAVEGAVNHVIGRRFDHGGMRWIRERAEALLQLRCIELNGQWDDFILFVQQQLQQQSKRKNRVRLLRELPGDLPTLELAS